MVAAGAWSRHEFGVCEVADVALENHIAEAKGRLESCKSTHCFPLFRSVCGSRFDEIYQ